MKVIEAGKIDKTMAVVMQYARSGANSVFSDKYNGNNFVFWEDIRFELKYKPDIEGKEVIRTMQETYMVGNADCEDFSIIISANLLTAKVPHFLRIYDFGRGWEHIGVVLTDGTVIDPVNDIFNVEPNYVKKKDYHYNNSNNGLGNIPTTDFSTQIKGKTQVKINNEIESLIDTKTDFSKEEIEFMYQHYEGSGGQGSKGATGEGLLYEFFTPDYICELMWKLAIKHGYDGGNVLEPSCATGRLITSAKDYNKVVGFEINRYSAKIAELKHKGMTVYNNYFETAFLQQKRDSIRYGKKGQLETWLQQYPFSLVIGNPPYGIYKNQFSSYFPFEKKMAQIETVFMYWALKMLKEGGLMVFITAQAFMRTGNKYQYAKGVLGEMCDLVDAYRLPSVFKFSEVPTDIIVLRRNGKN
jgi:type I restriction-modification system DNA methylase subunit